MPIRCTLSFIISILLLITFSPSDTYSQGIHDFDKIPLTWRNFIKKDASLRSNAAAQTAIELRINYEVQESKIIFVIEMVQLRNLSWVSKNFLRKATDQESEDLLNHEKLHYAINLIGLKKLLNALEETTFTSDYKSEISGIFNKINRATTKMNNDYDRQTVHGLRWEEQLKWNEYIFKEMENLYGSDTKYDTHYSLIKNINS